MQPGQNCFVRPILDAPAERDPRIPGNVKAAHHFWKWMGILLLNGGPLSIFFISWYWGVVIFIASFPVMNATRQSAGQFVLEAGLENESLYYECFQAGLLLVTKKYNANRPVQQITVPSGLSARFLPVALRVQEPCRKQAGIGHWGRSQKILR